MVTKAEEMKTQTERYALVSLLVMVFATASVTVSGADTSMIATRVDQNGSSSCRRPHNAGLHADGRTFICWAGPKMAPCVKMYDHRNATWSKTAIIHSYRSKDYHDYPTMVLGQDKHLHVFWTRHTREIYHSRSPKPLQIDGKWTHKVIKAAGATYPCPMVGPNGELYLFYRGRGGPSRSHADYLKSTDNGKSWKVVKDAISTQYKGKSRGFYLQHVTREPARGSKPLSYQMVWHLRFSPSSPLINVYFARFFPGQDVFKSVDGKDLGESISQDEAIKHCLVKETERASFEILSHAQENGHVTVFYSLWEEPEWVCARWTGKQWEEASVPFQPKEIEYLGANGLRVYAQDKDGVVWWESRDSGKNWRRAGSLALPVKGFSQCILIDNFNPEVRLFIKQDDKWNPKTYDGTDSIFVVGQKRTVGEQGTEGDAINRAP